MKASLQILYCIVLCWFCYITCLSKRLSYDNSSKAFFAQQVARALTHGGRQSHVSQEPITYRESHRKYKSENNQEKQQSAKTRVDFGCRPCLFKVHSRLDFRFTPSQPYSRIGLGWAKLPPILANHVEPNDSSASNMTPTLPQTAQVEWSFIQVFPFDLMGGNSRRAKVEWEVEWESNGTTPL